MRWVKRGLIFSPAGVGGWMHSHAQVPTVLDMGDRLRVYFAARPHPGLSMTSFVDLDRGDPSRVLAVHERPILELGLPGTFDADGVMPSSAVRDGDAVRLYYSGWCRLAGKAPYNNATGLAVSHDGGTTFARMFDGPILDRTAEEPWSATSPNVVRAARAAGTCGTRRARSGLETGGKMEHTYVIKSATSEDGIRWVRDNRAIFPVRGDDEAQTKPAVLFRDGRWHMWFCYRGSRGFRAGGETYRMGYATSRDLIAWERDDESAGIDVSESGWDAQMVCYPEVVDLGDRVLMFYNGNGFGAGGFGYAALA